MPAKNNTDPERQLIHDNAFLNFACVFFYLAYLFYCIFIVFLCEAL